MINKLKSSLFVQIFLIVLIVLSVFTALAFITYGRTIIGGDDANITFVYAKNFADGHGFVYNIGGERVEGFSSMLWVLIVAFLYKIFSNFNLVLLIINILCLSLSISYLLKTLLQLFSQKGNTKSLILIGIAIAWMVAVPNYIVWGTITLMEFGLYSSILITILTVILRLTSKSLTTQENTLYLCSISALVLIRPEGMLWGIVFIFLYFVSHLYKNNFKSSITASFKASLVFLISLVLLIGFRLAYFGYPFPNTYYAKVSSDFLYNLQQGYYYIVKFADSNSIAFILLGCTIVLFFISLVRIITAQRNPSKVNVSDLHLFIISTVVLTGIAIPILNGGDQFNQYRFIQPIWPLIILPGLYLVSLIEIQSIVIKSGRSYLIMMIPFVIFFTLYYSDEIVWHNYKEEFYETMAPQFVLTRLDMDKGLKLNKFFESMSNLPSLGVVAAGGIKMTYKGDVNDLLGLNNVEMAHANPIKIGVKNHAAFEKEIFYKQQPEMLNLLSVPALDITNNITVKDETNYWNTILKGLYNDKEFKQQYTKAVIYNKQTEVFLYGYYRNDLFEKLSEEIYTVQRLSS